MGEVRSENIAIMMNETGSELDEDEAKKYTFIEFDEDGNPLFEANISDPDECTDFDYGYDPDSILDRAMNQVQTKKREMNDSFEHGFDFPSEVRKNIVSNHTTSKNRKDSRGNRIKRTKKNANKQNKLGRKTNIAKPKKRFERVTAKSPSDENQESRRQKRIPLSIKQDVSDGARLLGKRSAIISKTESSLIPKRAQQQSPIIPKSNYVPQNYPQTVTETGLQWNVRQNSYTDLLLKNFNLISQAGKIIKLKCKLCGEGKRPISIILGNNSNLKAHMKAVHPKILEELTEENIIMKNTEQSGVRPILTTVTEKQIQDEVVHFMIKEALPLNKVESPHLKRLIDVCRGKFVEEKSQLQNGIEDKQTIMSRQTAVHILEKKATEHIENLKNLFSLVDDLSSTLDFWSKGGKSYMGVNVHFIDENLEIHSFTIALERFKGTHDYLSVAIRLNALFTKFGIIGKVGAVTTDQGSELVACFKHCGDDYASYDAWCDNDENTIWPIGEGDQVENEHLNDSEIVPINLLPENDDVSETQLNGFLAAMEETTNGDEDFQVQTFDLQCVDENPIEELPNRIKCGAHGLNSLCKTDSHYSLITSQTYRRMYVIVFHKLNQLWKKMLQKHGGEAIQKYLGRNLTRPHKVRWSSVYDSIVQILNQDQSSLAVLMVHLGIGAFTDLQLEFLKEFEIVFRPIMRAIKYVQGRYYFGSYLPMLFGLQIELNTEKHMKFCTPLVEALRNGFEKRFSDVMNPELPESVPLFVAMISNPKYKLNYVPQNLLSRHILRLKRMFLSAAEEMIERKMRKMNESQLNNDKESENVAGLSENDDDCGLFKPNFRAANYVHSEFGSTTSATTEISNYLIEPVVKEANFKDHLSKFPTIKQVFQKFNAFSSSEADCERLFSYAVLIANKRLWCDLYGMELISVDGGSLAMVLVPRRQTLTDEHFEQLLILYMNDDEKLKEMLIKFMKEQ